MNFFKSNGGFTLVELMVTVGIIGLLGAVSVPAVDRYRQRAVRSAARVEAQALMKAFRSCLATEEDISVCAKKEADDTVNIANMLKDVPDTINENTSFKGVACVADSNNIKFTVKKAKDSDVVTAKFKHTAKRCYFATNSDQDNICFASVKVTGGYVAWHCFGYDVTNGTVIDTSGAQKGLSDELEICEDGQCQDPTT